MAKAKQQALENLHAELADVLAKLVKAQSSSADGEQPNASILNVARQFLKDNNVSADIGTNEGLQRLTDSLPFTTTDAHGLRN